MITLSVYFRSYLQNVYVHELSNIDMLNGNITYCSIYYATLFVIGYGYSMARVWEDSGLL